VKRHADGSPMWAEPGCAALHGLRKFHMGAGFEPRKSL
jgi:hypothetical protein